jgi:hypothetical protein
MLHYLRWNHKFCITVPWGTVIWYVLAICTFGICEKNMRTSQNTSDVPAKNTILWSWKDGLKYYRFTKIQTWHLANTHCKIAVQIKLKNLIAFDYRLRRYSVWFGLFRFITLVYKCSLRIFLIKLINWSSNKNSRLLQ